MPFGFGDGVSCHPIIIITHGLHQNAECVFMCPPQVWWRRGFLSAWLNEPTSGWRTEACRFEILRSTEEFAIITVSLSRLLKMTSPPPASAVFTIYTRFQTVFGRSCTTCRTRQRCSRSQNLIHVRSTWYFSHPADGASESDSFKVPDE